MPRQDTNEQIGFALRRAEAGTPCGTNIRSRPNTYACGARLFGSVLMLRSGSGRKSVWAVSSHPDGILGRHRCTHGPNAPAAARSRSRLASHLGLAPNPGAPPGNVL